MANPLIDALQGFGSGALDLLDMPGSYTRGLLAGRPGERLSGTDLLNNYGVDPGDGVGGFLANMGVGIATDPLTYAIPGATAILKGARGLSLGRALPLRREVTFVKNAGSSSARPVGGFRTATGVPNMERLGETAATMNALESRLGAIPGDVQGMYFPSTRTGAVMETAVNPAATARHELTHALIDRGMASGNTAGLPLGWRAAANLKADPSNFVSTLGDVADEMAAHAADGSGAWSFLQRAHPAYAAEFSQTSPLAGAIFEGRYIPRAAAGAAGLAGAGLAGYIGSQLGIQ